MADEQRSIVEFGNASEANDWSLVNDGVMGGLSESSIEAVDGEMATFSGTLSLENNGGFASVRRPVPKGAFRDCHGIALRVRGDGRRYQFRVRTDGRFDGVSYRAEFQTKEDTWTTVALSFTSFQPTFRGRIVPDAPTLDPARIRQIGLLIGDRKAGEFRLDLDWIRALE